MAQEKATLVIYDANAPIPRNGETLVRLPDLQTASETYHRPWHRIRIELDDINSLAGKVSLFDSLGRTARIDWRVGGSVSVMLLNSPSQLVDGRNVLSMNREQNQNETTLSLRLGWPVATGSLVRACISSSRRVAKAPHGRERMLVEHALAPKLLGLSHAGAAWPPPGNGDAADPDNPGPTPMADRFLGSETLNTEVARVSELVGNPDRAPWVDTLRVGSGLMQANGFFDPRVLNPIGVKGNVTGGAVRTVWDPTSHELQFFSNSRSVASSQGELLQLKAVQSLRDVAYVEDSVIAHPGPTARADFLLATAAAGLPVLAADLDATTSSLLPESVRSLYEERRGTEAFDEREVREQAIARGVRAAHKALRQAKATYGWARELPEVSVVMSTMRPDFLSHALDQLEAQSDVVVEGLLGLHGFDIDDIPVAVRQRAASLGVKFFPFPSSTIFGDVLDALSTAADGEYVAKMDDDDWYGEYHLRDLVDAMAYSYATIVGSGVQYVYMNHSAMTIRRSIDQAYKYGGHPGGPTIMIQNGDLRDVGGWPSVTRAVDTGLNQRVVEAGGTVYQSGPQNFLFNRRSSGHTWKASNEYFYRLARVSWPGLVAPMGFDPKRAEQLRKGIGRAPVRLDSAPASTSRWIAPETNESQHMVH